MKFQNKCLVILKKSRNVLDHAGLKGTANEDNVHNFLRQYLPKNIEISSGIAVDSDGRKSKQLDIILHDAAKTPIFYQDKHTRVIPIECIYAVIEVKSSLNSVEIEKCFKNMASVKTLSKKAFFENNESIIIKKHNLYGKKWDYWPVQYFVFSFESLKTETILKHFIPFNSLLQTHQRIDSILILDKGLIFNQDKNEMVSITPTNETRNVVIETPKNLLLFYSLLTTVLNQAQMEPFNIKPYLNNIIF